MGRIVQKFGGTSVANVECIKNAANKVLIEHNKGNQVIVVVSAMAGWLTRFDPAITAARMVGIQSAAWKLLPQAFPITYTHPSL